MFSMEYFSCVLPLNFIRRVPSLDHGHETLWWRELLFFDGWLPWLDVLDRGSLMALLTLLHHVRRWVRWWWRSVESYHACYRLVGLHPLLKSSTETEEFPALDEEMCRSSDSIFIEVRVPCAPSIEHLFR
jgi:hypothetical protein